MAKYVRFVTHLIDEDSGYRQGVFQAAAELRDQLDLDARHAEALEELRIWFNENLETPTKLSASAKKQAAPRAISWYKPESTDHISRMREMCRILYENGVATSMILSGNPGKVVFEDGCQIAVIPFRDSVA